jgi:sulfite exporter TauE/SafE
MLLEEKISGVMGVKSVKVDYRSGEAKIRHGADIPSNAEIEAAVKDAGYEIGTPEKKNWLSKDFSDYRNIGTAALILLAVYYAARGLGLTNLSIETQNATYGLAFMIGLVAGISSCMALVGGLLAGISARHSERHPEATSWQKFRPHLYFNFGRVAGYALFGGLLGTLGGFLKLSGGVLAALTLVVGLVMLVLGVKLTGLSPRLKDATITLPPWISRRLGIGRHEREYSHRGSIITGALTFFLPCGFTQALQIYTIGTGSFQDGALTMALFAMGTAPALLSIGGLTSIIKGRIAKKFYATIGLAVLIFGIVNVGNALALVGIAPSISGRSVASDGLPEIQNGYQIVRMTQKSYGYEPSSFTLRRGVPVRWIITSENAYTCAASIVVPSLNISRYLSFGENVIEFTPQENGVIPFSCSMGMYRGSFTVTDGGSSAKTTKKDALAKSGDGGSCGAGGCGCGGGVRKNTEPAAAASWLHGCFSES